MKWLIHLYSYLFFLILEISEKCKQICSGGVTEAVCWMKTAQIHKYAVAQLSFKIHFFSKYNLLFFYCGNLGKIEEKFVMVREGRMGRIKQIQIFK